MNKNFFATLRVWVSAILVFSAAIRPLAQTFRPASESLPAEPLNFDGGTTTVTGQVTNTWRYFRIQVPTNALGWDIRLTNITQGQPRLVVRRDVLPASLLTFPWTAPGTSTNWPSTNQWAAGADWTRRA